MTHKSLSKAAVKYLKGVSHGLNPYVTIADKGITDNIMTELETTLDHHELVKIKIRADREQRTVIIDELIKRTKATEIQRIGQTLTLYRANPKNPVYELPR
ncbi:YhbY family RNA-binding protein [Marinicella gelatinilytica]|uniref:YhbY family RNA-binding protein n=1 Tax=Marinicella gelatinilytica TaxID=2996017 RepID=UPI00226092B9|nr:YhbY family RNA-binding protein [Marinicella gelatinilytica]MCX7544353.1 YhbY family RNA-binding protein [Marinicella gelatinilytica]